MKNLKELFVEELADAYSAEQQLIKALPKTAEAAESEELKEAFESHLQETEEHARRLEQVFELFGEKAKAKKCKAMAGLIAEVEDLISEDVEGAVKDAGIIAQAQKIEHYEISLYGTLRTWAELLGNQEAASLLEETENEEKEADEKLNGIAESLNIEAIEEEGEEEEEESANPRIGRSKNAK
jgi:ferritin-like metal-binding protein YciE